MNERVGGVQCAGFAPQGVALGILRAKGGNRAPVAHVAPDTLELDRSDVCLFFKNSGLEAGIAACLEQGGIQPGKITIDRELFDGMATVFKNIRRTGANGVRQGACLHEVDPDSPQCNVLQDQRLSTLAAEFFKENRWFECRRHEVTVLRARVSGSHSECHHAALLCSFDARENRLSEQVGIGNMVVRRDKKQQVFRLAHERGNAHRCSTSPTHRLEDLASRQGRGFHRLLHQEPMCLGADARDFSAQRLGSLQCQRQGALASQQGYELRRPRFSGKWPQPRLHPAQQYRLYLRPRCLRIQG